MHTRICVNLYLSTFVFVFVYFWFVLKRTVLVCFIFLYLFNRFTHSAGPGSMVQASFGRPGEALRALGPQLGPKLPQNAPSWAPNWPQVASRTGYLGALLGHFEAISGEPERFWKSPGALQLSLSLQEPLEELCNVILMAPWGLRGLSWGPLGGTRMVQKPMVVDGFRLCEQQQALSSCTSL